MQNEAIQRFRAAFYRFAIALTGGGSEFIAHYLTLPGASATFLDAAIPYCQQATDEYLGFHPEGYCTEQVARQLAAKALWRAAKFDHTDVTEETNAQLTLKEDLLGVGVTASLATSRPKKGAHRVYCAVLSYRGAFSASLFLKKNARSRLEEEHITADFILNVLNFAIERLKQLEHSQADPAQYWREFSESLPIQDYFDALLEDSATISYAFIDRRSAQFLYAPDFRDANDAQVQALLWRSGTPETALVAKNNTVALYPYVQFLQEDYAQPLPDSDLSTSHAFFPGSFNPPHQGHYKIVALADQILKTTVAPEISAVNVDKPPLDPIEIIRRMRALNSALPERDAWLTNAPLYRQKAQIAPNATFVVGTDTILRLADPKYENNDVTQRDAMLRLLSEHNARFLVFSRRVNDKIYNVNDLRVSLPQPLASMCEFVEPDVFLDDSSSTELRRKERKQMD